MTLGEFGDIGKAAKDLLTKDFNFGKTKFEAKTSTSGIEFTTTLERNAADSSLRGELKSKLQHSGVTFTDTYTTSNEVIVKAELPQLLDGLKGDLEVTFNPNAPISALKAGFNFKSENLTSTGSVDVLPKAKAKFDVAVGQAGLIAGAQVSYDVAQGSLSDFALALGYSQKEYNVALQANKSLTQYVASFQHTVSSDVSVASRATWGNSDKNILIEFGTQRKIDQDTTLKATVDTTGKVGLGYGLKLRPDLKAFVSILVDTRNLDADAHKYGYSFTYEPK